MKIINICEFVKMHLLFTYLLLSRSVVSTSFATQWTVASPDSSLDGIVQARIVEWVAIFFSITYLYYVDKCSYNYVLSC